MKYNPLNKDLLKSKLKMRALYKKGTFITDTSTLAEIIANGGQIEITAQETRDLNGVPVQALEIKVFYISTNI